MAQINAINQDTSGLRLVERGNESDNRGLSRSRGANQRRDRTWLGDEAYVFQYRFCGIVSKVHMLEADESLDVIQRDRTFRIAILRTLA